MHQTATILGRLATGTHACPCKRIGEKIEDGRALGWSFGSKTEVEGRVPLRARREGARNAEVKSAGTVTGARRTGASCTHAKETAMVVHKLASLEEGVPKIHGSRSGQGYLW